MKSMRWVVMGCAVALVGCGGAMEGTDAGAGGGGGGGTAATGGGTGGGLETDAGYLVTDAGHDAGVVETDAGFLLADGGIDCGRFPLDVQTGAYVKGTGVTIARTVALPSGVGQVALVGSTLYGLTSSSIVSLGSVAAPATGATLVDVTTPADGGSVFVSGFLAATSTQLMAGYTKSDFSGLVTVFDVTDGGVTHTSSSGNYDAVGTPLGFLVNSIDLGSSTGAGLYGWAQGQTVAFSTFPADSYSGNVGWANGVALVAYYDSTTFQNVVKAVPTSRFTTPPFALAADVTVFSGGVSDIAAAGDDAVLVIGDYGAPQNLVRYPLVRTDATFTVGAQTPVLTSTNTCTSVLFIANNGAHVLVGLEDRNGRRLLDVQP